MNVNHNECIRCLNCIAECGNDAINYDGKYISIDSEKCQQCGFCIETCPAEAISND